MTNAFGLPRLDLAPPRLQEMGGFNPEPFGPPPPPAQPAPLEQGPSLVNTDLPALALPTGPSGRTFAEITGTEYQSDDEALWYWQQKDPTGASWPEWLRERQNQMQQALQFFGRAQQALGQIQQANQAVTQQAQEQRNQEQALAGNLIYGPAGVEQPLLYGPAYPLPQGNSLPERVLRGETGFDLGETVGGALTQQIAPLRTVQEAAGDIGERFGPLLLAPLYGAASIPGGPSLEDVPRVPSRAAAGRFVAEAAVPTTPLEVGLELLPGIGSVPGTASFARQAVREGLPAATVAALGLGSRTAGALLREGIEANPTVLRVAARPGAVSAASEPGVAAARGALQVVDPSGVRLLRPGEALQEGEQLLFHGTQGGIEGAGLRSGAFLTPSVADAATYARAAATLAEQQPGLLRRVAREETGAVRLPGAGDEAARQAGEAAPQAARGQPRYIQPSPEEQWRGLMQHTGGQAENAARFRRQPYLSERVNFGDMPPNVGARGPVRPPFGEEPVPPLPRGAPAGAPRSIDPRDILRRAQANPRNVTNRELDDALEAVGLPRRPPYSYGKTDTIRALERQLGAAGGAAPPAGAAAPPPGGTAPPAGGGAVPSGSPAGATGAVTPPPFPLPSKLHTLDEITQDAISQSERFTHGLTGKAAQLPVVRTASNLINPSALIAAPPERLVNELGEKGATRLQGSLLGHARRIEQGNALASAVEDGIRQRSRAVGFVTRDGRVVSVPGSPALGDLFENPSKYRLTSQQREFVNQVHQVLDDMNSVEKAAGVKKGEIFSDEGRYFPRRVIESAAGAKNVRPGVRRLVGSKQSFQQGRFYELMEEGLANGVRYADDPAALVGTRIRAGIKATGDKEIADLLAPFGRTITAGEPARIGEMGTMVPALGPRAFPTETANRVIEALGTHFPGVIERGLGRVNDFLRPLQAIGDMGYIGLQGLATAFNNPPAFARGVAAAFDAVITDGRFYGGYVLNNARQIERFTSRGLLWRGSELSFESAAKGKVLSKIFGRGPLGRLGAGFDNALNVMALENAKAMAGVTEALGPGPVRRVMSTVFGNISGETSDEVAAAVANKLTGRLSSGALGVNAAQRTVEGAAAFAPNYYRASFGLLGDALQGGMRGAEARRAVAGLVGGAITLHIAAAHALDQEPNLDPTSSKFLTLRIGNQNVGLGGPMYGFFRTIAEAAENPGDLNDILSMKNPVTRWARGRLSPVLSLAVDLAAGESYLGKQISSPEEVIQHIATRALPFAAQTALTGSAEEGAAQFFGLRSFPVSTPEKLGEAREAAQVDYGSLFPPEIAQAIQGQEYFDLGPRERAIVDGYIQQQRPDLVEQYEKERRERQSPFQVADDAVIAMYDRYKDDFDKLYQGLLNGGDGAQIRETLSDLKTEIRGAKEQIYSSDEYQKAVEGIPETDINRLVSQYFSVPDRVAAANNGVVNWQVVEQVQQEIIATAKQQDPALGTRLEFNVQDYPRPEEHPLLRAYDKAQPLIDAYYDVDESQRQTFREANPAADMLLWLLGYVTTLRSDEAVRLAEEVTDNRNPRRALR